MNEHPLDRPVWASLSSVHQGFSTGTEHAKRFLPEIGPLAGVPDDSEQSLGELADLLERSGSLAVPQASELPGLRNGTLKTRLPLVQMLYEGPLFTPNHQLPIEPLMPDDAKDMYALAKQTIPGPFENRTHELGQFWGIKQDGNLVAMAGERMKTPGFVEVSAICTHPDFEGRGFGKALTMHVCNIILSAGMQPFLHVFEDNSRAIKLYESLGFVPRKELSLHVLEYSG